MNLLYFSALVVALTDYCNPLIDQKNSMKRPRSSIVAFALFTQITFAARYPLHVDDEGELSPSLHHHPDGSPKQQQNKKTSSSSALTVNLSTSSHPRSTNNGKGSMMYTPTIPLIGIRVGNMPHNKIPYILGLGLGQSKNKKNVLNGEELNYRLIDTSHTDSALEVLVGRSLTRLSSSATSGAGSGAGSNNKPSAAASSSKTEDYDDENNNVYHVMIKIWLR